MTWIPGWLRVSDHAWAGGMHIEVPENGAFDETFEQEVAPSRSGDRAVRWTPATRKEPRMQGRLTRSVRMTPTTRMARTVRIGLAGMTLLLAGACSSSAHGTTPTTGHDLVGVGHGFQKVNDALP